jgi:hypothetical protein
LFISIITYEIRWIIHPRVAVNQAGYLNGLHHLEFVVHDGRWNVPLLSGVLALITLSIVVALRLEASERIASTATLVVTLMFVAWAVFAAIAPWASDAAFSPFSQFQARGQALIVGTALAAVAVGTLLQKTPAQIWLRPTTLVVIAALACAQFSWDIAATQRWRAFIADTRARLAESNGLISWERALALGDDSKNQKWRAIAKDFGWTLPSLSVVLQSGTVHSIIAAPKGTSWQPLDPSNLNGLPRIRGVDFTPYVQTMTVRQSSKQSALHRRRCVARNA